MLDRIISSHAAPLTQQSATQKQDTSKNDICLLPIKDLNLDEFPKSVGSVITQFFSVNTILPRMAATECSARIANFRLQAHFCSFM
jgi:hypothetical protein